MDANDSLKSVEKKLQVVQCNNHDVHATLWTLSRKVNLDAFLDKATNTTTMTKKISKNRNKIMLDRSIVLIDLLPFGAYTLALFLQLDSYLFTTL
jgi:hypothetical protein